MGKPARLRAMQTATPGHTSAGQSVVLGSGVPWADPSPSLVPQERVAVLPHWVAQLRAGHFHLLLLRAWQRRMVEVARLR